MGILVLVVVPPAVWGPKGFLPLVLIVGGVVSLLIVWAIKDLVLAVIRGGTDGSED